MIKGQVKNNLERLNILIPEDVLEKIETYDRLLIHWNKKINLTGYTKEEDRAIWLYTEAIWAATRFSDIKKLVDVGCGCGLPGLAFQWKNRCHIMLLEAKEKKTHFLKEVIRQLEMEQTEVQNRQFNGELSFIKRKETESIYISWRAVNLNKRVLKKLNEELRKDDGLLCFFGKESKNYSWTETISNSYTQRKEVFPFAANRQVIQMIKCST